MALDILSPLDLSPPFALGVAGAAAEAASHIIVVLSEKTTTVLQEDSDAVTFHAFLKEPDGDVLDLTGAEAVQVIATSAAGVKRTKAVAVLDAAAGKVAYTPYAGDFSDPVRWKLQAKVFWADGTVYFSAVYKVKVKANL